MVGFEALFDYFSRACRDNEVEKAVCTGSGITAAGLLALEAVRMPDQPAHKANERAISQELRAA